MHVVRKAVSVFLFAMVSAAMLTACKGGSNSTVYSAEPPTDGSWSYAVTTATPTNPLSLTFTASPNSKSADGNPVTFTWTFGDQVLSTSTQANSGSPVTHLYAEPGTYDVTLTTTDDHGTAVTSTKTIVVQPASTTVALGVETWSWVGGNKYANGVGTFETQFQPDPKNMPSARQYASTWYSGGKLWMFGGSGYDSVGTVGSLNDLWNCTPTPTTTNGVSYTGCVWTWVAGSSKANASGLYPASPGQFSATSIPGGRFATGTWTDLNGNMWLFGGAGVDHAGNSGLLNDMWSFSANGQSEWVSGSSSYNDQGSATTPSARAYATTWTDKDGNFWLFGGQSATSSGTTVYLNDLWCFTPSYPPGSPAKNHPSCATEDEDEKAGGATNVVQGTPILGGTWTQVMTGTPNGTGTYGTVKTPATTNIPGARLNAQTWVAADGTVWMFGGYGYDSTGALGSLSDVWYFNPKATLINKATPNVRNWWTYASGATTAGAVEAVVKQKYYGATNTPSARLGTAGWTDKDGTTLWMFGGSGSDTTGTSAVSDGGGALNELWAYNTLTNQWAFMAGTTISVNADGTTAPAAGGGGVAGSASLFSALGVPSTYNIPGSRLWPNLWVDSSNNIWILGGTGDDAVGTSGYLNDLWLMQTTTMPQPGS